MRLALGVVVLVASGCASLGSMQTASTLGKGNVTGGVQGDIGLVYYFNPQAIAGTTIGNPTVYPTVNGFVRFGLTDQFDLGIRGGSTLLEVNPKFMFTDPENPNFALSVAPAITGFYLPAFSSGTSTTPALGALSIPVPLLIGIKFGANELVFGPRMLNQLVWINDRGTTGFGYGIAVGTSIGYSIRLTKGFVLMPEIAVQVPIFVSAYSQFGSAQVVGVGSFQMTAGISCGWGKFKPRPEDGPAQLEPPPVENPPEYQAPPPVAPTPAPLPPDVAPPPPPPPPPPP